MYSGKDIHFAESKQYIPHAARTYILLKVSNITIHATCGKDIHFVESNVACIVARTYILLKVSNITIHATCGKAIHFVENKQLIPL